MDQAKLHLFMGNYDENDSESGDDSPWIDMNGEKYMSNVDHMGASSIIYECPSPFDFICVLFVIDLS